MNKKVGKPITWFKLSKSN